MGRINDGNNVVIDESRVIACPAALQAKPLLQWREGAYPAVKLKKSRIDDNGEMYPGEAQPFEEKESPKDHKEDKGEMDENNDVGKEEIEHSIPEPGWITLNVQIGETRLFSPPDDIGVFFSCDSSRDLRIIEGFIHRPVLRHDVDVGILR